MSLSGFVVGRDDGENLPKEGGEIVGATLLLLLPLGGGLVIGCIAGPTDGINMWGAKVGIEDIALGDSK